MCDYVNYRNVIKIYKISIGFFSIKCNILSYSFIFKVSIIIIDNINYTVPIFIIPNCLTSQITGGKKQSDEEERTVLFPIELICLVRHQGINWIIQTMISNNMYSAATTPTSIKNAPV